MNRLQRAYGWEGKAEGQTDIQCEKHREQSLDASCVDLNLSKSYAQIEFINSSVVLRLSNTSTREVVRR